MHFVISIVCLSALSFSHNYTAAHQNTNTRAASQVAVQTLGADVQRLKIPTAIDDRINVKVPSSLERSRGVLALHKGYDRTDTLLLESASLPGGILRRNICAFHKG